MTGEAWVGAHEKPLDVCLSLSNGTGVVWTWNSGRTGDVTTEKNSTKDGKYI